MNEFCSTLRERRKSVGLSQKRLAERAGLTPKTVRMLELGRINNPRKYTVEVINTAIEEVQNEKYRVLTGSETK